MLKLRIDHKLDKPFIVLALGHYISQTLRPRKHKFIEYMKKQIDLFGTCEDSQFSSSSYDLYNLHKSDIEKYYCKWFEKGEKK